MINSWQISLKRTDNPDTGYTDESFEGLPFGMYYPYFTQRLFDKDSSSLVVSISVDGVWQAGVIDLSSMEIHQLTDGPGIKSGGSCLDPLGENVYA
jgi:hypothetical protein